MSDADRLTPADPQDTADTLAFALRYSGRKRTHDAFAVATDITPALVEAYRRWLELEQFLLMEERPMAPRILPRPSMVDWSDSQIRGYLDAEERVAKTEDDFRARCCNFHFRAGLSSGVIQSPVDRFYLNRQGRSSSPPASTRGRARVERGRLRLEGAMLQGPLSR